MSTKSFDPERRHLLAGATALATAGFTGCALWPHEPQIPGTCSPMPEPFLAGPEVLKAWQGPARYFDAHTHFFNAQDVPVKGFLSKSVAHGLPDEVQRLVIALAPVAEALARLAQPPHAEMTVLCNRDGLKARALADATAELDADIETRARGVADELFKDIQGRGDEIPRLVNQAAARLSPATKSRLSEDVPGFSLDFLNSAFRDGGSTRVRPSGGLRPLRDLGLSAQERTYFDMKAVFQFVLFMLSPRHHNLRTYIKQSSESSPGLPLSGCFATIVDFNYWLDRPQKASHLQDQVLLHEQLSLSSRGFMLPLVAYNPWVDIKESDASLRLVRWAIEEHGFVGVKLYPPMGFAPYNNQEICRTGCQPGPDPVELDRRLKALYELCDELGVPVMAHANESMGRDSEHDRLGGAQGWKDVRDMLPNLNRLYVNAGHFGGAKPHASGDWTDDFIELMDNEGRLRMYADLGYWDELLRDSAAQAKLARRLTTSLSAARSVAERVMYGSDWLMLSLVSDWPFYGNAVADLVRRSVPTPEIADRVLGGNALACFGLDPMSDRDGLRRLIENFVKKGVTRAPGWLKEDTDVQGSAGRLGLFTSETAAPTARIPHDAS